MLVSVIIPTYNYAHYIKDAIESVLTQENFEGEIEIIIVDDGSKDNTADVVAQYGNKIRYIFQENQGKAKATQVGIENAKGKYLFNLDADDFFMPTRIAEAVAVFESDAEIVHVAHPALMELTETSVQHPEAVPAHLLNAKISGKVLLQEFYLNRIFYGGGSTFAVRADTMRKFPVPTGVDMYTDEYLVIFPVYDGYSFLIDHPLSVCRTHGQNFSHFSQSPEVIRRKQQRLLDSSRVLYEEVAKYPFEPSLKKIMLFNHYLRELVFKEDYTGKSLKDILQLWQNLFDVVKPWQPNFFRIFKSYTIPNRSLPTQLLKFLKKKKK